MERIVALWQSHCDGTEQNGTETFMYTEYQWTSPARGLLSYQMLILYYASGISILRLNSATVTYVLTIYYYLRTPLCRKQSTDHLLDLTNFTLGGFFFFFFFFLQTHPPPFEKNLICKELNDERGRVAGARHAISNLIRNALNSS